MTIKRFGEKKIIVMGLGLHGGGRAAAAWFFRQGARVTVTDQKSESELSEPLASLEKDCAVYRAAHPAQSLHEIAYHLGGHREDDFRSADLVIQNPGVPRESPYLSIARDEDIQIENEATIFFALTKKTPKICVTGTRGKSTTTALIGAMVGQWNDRALVGGIATRNGTTALFDILDVALAHESEGVIPPVVLELSSWHLELFAGRGYAPAIAVVTNVLADHLNRYESADEYAQAKRLLFVGQTSKQAVILNYDNATTVRWGLSETAATRYWFTHDGSVIDRGCSVERVDGVPMIVWKNNGTVEHIMPVDMVRLHSDHQLENALAAGVAAKVWGVPNDIIARTLADFAGLPDRCETVSEAGGRTWINDTAATTPDATIAALKTVRADGNLILIAGGADKRLDYSSLAPVIASRASALILLSGTATPLIASALEAASASVPITGANSMADAVRAAWSRSEKGDTILLSPAAASFGMFVHEFDRGRQFIEAIKTIDQ